MYSPKVREQQVRRLYLLKQTEKRPMTLLVSEAIEQYLLKKENRNERSNKTCN